MDVTNAEQAKIAQEAGACAVMALDKVPYDILKNRKNYGVARMASPEIIKQIRQAVTIPVMAKCRIGHFVEAQILEHLQVDFIDESEVLSPADYESYIDKRNFKVPFVGGCRNLPEALRRINEGAVLIRTKGEAGTGDVRHAVENAKSLKNTIRQYKKKSQEEKEKTASEWRIPASLLEETFKLGRLPAVTFAAGGIAIPADAALMMQLGCDGIFVGSVRNDFYHLMIREFSKVQIQLVMPKVL